MGIVGRNDPKKTKTYSRARAGSVAIGGQNLYELVKSATFPDTPEIFGDFSGWNTRIDYPL